MKKYGDKVCYSIISLLLVLTNFFLLLPIANSATTAQITATVAVGVCGNNVVEFGEDCDGSALDGQTCTSLGYDGGTLSCNLGCDFNLSECVNLEPVIETGSIVFSGKGYPYSVIKILKDGQIAATTAAGANGDYSTTLSDLVTGSYVFAVYAYDANGEKSKTLTYQEIITKDEILEVNDIIIPPTLVANKNSLKQGEKITFSGYGAPSSSITITVESNNDRGILSTASSSSGYYSYKLDTDSFDNGAYTAVATNTITGYPESAGSEEVYFDLEEKDSKKETETDSESSSASYQNSQCSQAGDVNRDCRVNQIDFSIFLNWHKKTNFPGEVDLNKNRQVDLHDLSIMMYYWTG